MKEIPEEESQAGERGQNEQGCRRCEDTFPFEPITNPALKPIAVLLAAGDEFRIEGTPKGLSLLPFFGNGIEIVSQLRQRSAAGRGAFSFAGFELILKGG